jgi:hypothetical protein
MLLLLFHSFGDDDVDDDVEIDVDGNFEFVIEDDINCCFCCLVGEYEDSLTGGDGGVEVVCGFN